MTGSNTDAVIVASYMQASSLLLKLASPLFQAWMHTAAIDPLDVHYDSWFTLRQISAAFLERRHTCLTPKDRESLVNALWIAHELAHDNDLDDTPPVEYCHCQVSEDLRDLVVVIEEGKQETAAVSQ